MKTNVTVKLHNGSELKGRITQTVENVFYSLGENHRHLKRHQLCRCDDGERKRFRQKSKVRYAPKDEGTHTWRG